jgi:hypothetical protein
VNELMVFQAFQKSFTSLLILKKLTEILLCDWSMFSSADLSLAAEKMRKNNLVTGGFRYDFTKLQAASCKHFQCQIRRFRE